MKKAILALGFALLVFALVAGRKRIDVEPIPCASGVYAITIPALGVARAWKATPEQAGLLLQLFPDASVLCIEGAEPPDFDFGTGPAGNANG